MEKQHTIVFDARLATDEFSGIQRYTRSLLRAVAPLLWPQESLHVLLPETETSWLEESDQVRLHVLPAPIETLAGHWQAFRTIRSLNPEVTHSPSVFTPVHIPGRLVLTIHDVIPFSHPRFNSAFTRWIWKRHGRRAVQHAKRLIGCSADALKTAEKFFGARVKAQGTVIPTGVDTSFRPQPAEQVEAVRKKYNLPEKFLLYVGSDEPHKNLSTLLRAIAELDQTASFPLVVAGLPSDAHPLRKEADDLNIPRGRVIWLPAIPESDLPALYCAARTFLFPSLVEGFCFPVLEAMACGTPVICSALPVLKELTADAAKVVHPTDVQEWIHVIQSAIVSIDWHDTFREKGLQRASLFTWEKTAHATLNVWRSLYPKYSNEGV